MKVSGVYDGLRLGFWGLGFRGLGFRALRKTRLQTLTVLCAPRPTDLSHSYGKSGKSVAPAPIPSGSCNW